MKKSLDVMQREKWCVCQIDEKLSFNSQKGLGNIYFKELGERLIDDIREKQMRLIERV